MNLYYTNFHDSTSPTLVYTMNVFESLKRNLILAAQGTWKPNLTKISYIYSVHYLTACLKPQIRIL